MSALLHRMQRASASRLGMVPLPYLFLLPALAIWLLLVAYPLLNALLLSLQSWDGLRPPVWVGFANFEKLLEDRIFLLALGNTAVFVVATVIFQSTIPLLIANLIYRGVHGSTAFRTIYFMPVVISLAVSGMLWSIIYEPNFGVLNSVLRSIGLGDLAQLWLANKDTVLPSLILVSVWQSLGFYLVVYFAALQAVPRELLESAEIDGANAWQQLTRVTVPLLAPVITVVVVLNTINGVRAFDQIWVMTAGGPNHASQTFGTYLYTIAFGALGSSNAQLGYASAIGVLILVIALILSIVQIRWGKAGETEY
jgi:ABC-type sugar transport system permease subunit